TVIARGRSDLTLLTAAHCLSAEDVGRQITLRRGEQVVQTRVLAVARNPSYGTTPQGEVPGADNALALVRLLEPEQPPTIWKELAPASISLDILPDPDGETLPIVSIDQFEKLHAVRAGNYSNPRWLEWGNAYRPIPGDSGSGVFVLRRQENGTIQPILIGVVTDRSQLGGGGSVISRRHAWIAQALRPAPAGTDPSETTESGTSEANRR
ncbi:MAG TPA: hypothetical protein VFT74_21375, partial [Isosphaeraceae bacterium]|nr:hypothetical protein [Isosphaeraceae bacterium]